MTNKTKEGVLSSKEKIDIRNTERRKRYSEDKNYKKTQKKMNQSYYNRNKEVICDKKRKSRKISNVFKTKTVDINGHIVEVYSIKEVAKRIGISRVTYLQRERAGFFPQTIRDEKKHRLFTLEHIDLLKKALQVGEFKVGVSPDKAKREKAHKMLVNGFKEILNNLTK